MSWPTQLNKHSQKDPAEERQKVLQAAVGTGVHCRVVNCFCLLAAFLQTLGSFTVRRGLTATVVAIGARRRGMCSVARSGSGAINPDTERACRAVGSAVLGDPNAGHLIKPEMVGRECLRVVSDP